MKCNNCDKELNDVYACLFTRWYCLYCAWSIAEDKEKYPWIK